MRQYCRQLQSLPSTLLSRRASRIRKVVVPSSLQHRVDHATTFSSYSRLTLTSHGSRAVAATGVSLMEQRSNTSSQDVHSLVAGVAMYMAWSLTNYDSENSTQTHSLHASSRCSAEGMPDKSYSSPLPSASGNSKIDLNELPVYSSKDVARNNGKDGKPIWMSYGGAVYDVTNFIQNHPGGSERILLAAGSAVEPYWHLYRQHFATDLPMRYMESLQVGRLLDSDQEEIDQRMEKIMNETEDPYAHEPKRHESLISHSDQPANYEVPRTVLTNEYLTPNELFYIRHHHPVPLLSVKDVDSYELDIDLSGLLGKGKKRNSKQKVSLKDIKSKIPKIEVVTTLQCSGNRRGDMNGVKRTSGTSWGQGAISTAKWGGARLVDVLKLVGLKDPVAAAQINSEIQKHARFESLDGMKASIPIEKAVNPFGDVILAYEMNGEELPREHGFPLRVIVPGYSAVRNVKWVKKIELADSEAEGAWQRGLNYKTLPPSVTNANQVNLKQMPSMTESSVFSGITKADIMSCTRGTDKVMVKASGWAWAGGGRNVVRIDVTGDDGESWATANIVKGAEQKFGHAWAWVFWECEVETKLDKDGSIKLASKAVDMAFNSQPENCSHSWNVRGLGNNSWYRAKFDVMKNNSRQ